MLCWAAFPFCHNLLLLTGACLVQVGFFDFVALPMFQAFVEVMPDSTPLLDAISKNYKLWVKLENEMKEQELKEVEQKQLEKRFEVEESSRHLDVLERRSQDS